MEKKLYKSHKKMICGVCAGIAEYFNIDPTIVRLISVVLSLGSIGLGIVIYIIAAVIMPDEPIEN
jgi:phage shock protein C